MTHILPCKAKCVLSHSWTAATYQLIISTLFQTEVHRRDSQQLQNNILVDVDEEDFTLMPWKDFRVVSVYLISSHYVMHRYHRRKTAAKWSTGSPVMGSATLHSPCYSWGWWWWMLPIFKFLSQLVEPRWLHSFSRFCSLRSSPFNNYSVPLLPGRWNKLTSAQIVIHLQVGLKLRHHLRAEEEKIPPTRRRSLCFLRTENSVVTRYSLLLSSARCGISCKYIRSLQMYDNKSVDQKHQ